LRLGRGREAEGCKEQDEGDDYAPTDDATILEAEEVCAGSDGSLSRPKKTAHGTPPFMAAMMISEKERP
jgi:hypothetical protein